MIRPQPTPQPLIATGLPIDHIGIVVHDLAAEVAAWRAAGFLVSDPVPLMGAGAAGEPVPIGQSSAHVVFHNGYVELSSPVPGSGNHLEPYLAHGEGVRILVLAAGDAEAARQKLASAWPHMPEVRRASRSIIVGDEQGTARFRWFPLPEDIVPGALSAVVEHETRELVLDPRFVEHPNGWSRIASVIAEGNPEDLLPLSLPEGVAVDSPELVVLRGEGALAITALTLGAEGREESSFRLV